MRAPRHSGFTLVELMVTVAIAVILLVIGVPSFQTVIYSNRLTSAANELVAGLQSARAEAVRFNRRAELCLSTDSNNGLTATCAADNAINATGWIVFLDTDRNGTYNAGDRLIRVATVGDRIVIKGSPNLTGKVKVAFRSDGLARQATATGSVLTGTVALCIPATRPSENLRHVSIRSGGISIVRPPADPTCAEPVDST